MQDKLRAEKKNLYKDEIHAKYNARYSRDEEREREREISEENVEKGEKTERMCFLYGSVHTGTPIVVG